MGRTVEKVVAIANSLARAGDELTDEEIATVVAAAVQDIDEVHLELRTVSRINPGSNIWKVICSTGGSEIEFTIYVFPDASPEELSDIARERLGHHLPRWQALQSV